jgi:hypothetical protein
MTRSRDPLTVDSSIFEKLNQFPVLEKLVELESEADPELLLICAVAPGIRTPNVKNVKKRSNPRIIPVLMLIKASLHT